METKPLYKKLAIALIAVLAATFLTLAIPSLSDGGMYFLFLTAIIFSTLQGDVRAGIFAAVLSLTVDFVLLVYLDKWPKSLGDWTVFLAFGLAAGFTVLLCHVRAESDKARLKAETRYRVIFEDAITGIYETTVDGRYITANPKLAEILGYDYADHVIDGAENLNDRFYIQKDRRQEFSRSVEQKNHLAGFESEVFRKDGSTIWISENAVAVRDENSELVGFLGTTIDITDRKNAEAELSKAREELEKKVVERTADLELTNQVLRDEMAERQRIQNELLASRTQLRDLTAHLQSVREDERKYIARELHDELGQKLTAVKIELTRMNDGGGKSRAPKILNSAKILSALHLVDAAMETTRKIVSELRPAVLDELGLQAALEWQVQEFYKRTGITFNLEIDFNEDQILQEAKITLFRILQECLTNIIRHANAKHVDVVLKEEPDKLVLVVEDDGQGISDEEIGNPRSFGIVGMRERALLLGGIVSIDRGAAAGTKILVEIPSSPSVREHL